MFRDNEELQSARYLCVSDVLQIIQLTLLMVDSETIGHVENFSLQGTLPDGAALKLLVESKSSTLFTAFSSVLWCNSHLVISHDGEQARERSFSSS